MHTPVVRRIVHAVCTKHWTMAHPFSCSSFLVPALTRGIPEQLEAVCTGHGEIAVYVSLFMSIYVGARLGGFFAPPQSKYDDLRREFDLGYNIGLVCGLINVMVSIFFRASAATMARESDMLVFLAKSRYYSQLNILIFLVGGTLGMMNCLGAAIASDRGDFCLDGSISYMEWWYEWALDEYPKGKGVFHEEGAPILNPWAIKATNLSLTTDWKPPSSSRPNVNIASARGDDAWPKYMEFMQAHFDLTDQGCFGFYANHVQLFWIFILLPPLAYLCFSRNSHFYWMIGTELCGKFCCSLDDPFDLTIAWDEFSARARVGAKLASRDTHSGAFIDPTKAGNVFDTSRIFSKEELASSEELAPEVAPPSPSSLPALEVHKELLDKAGLDGNTMRQLAEQTLYLALKDAGIDSPGDRAKIINAVRENRHLRRRLHHHHRASSQSTSPASASLCVDAVASSEPAQCFGSMQQFQI